MSTYTATAPYASGARYPAGITRRIPQRVSTMLLAYILLLPMLFFAAGGEFSFESKTGKTDSGLSGNHITAMQTSEETGQRVFETLLFFPILIVAIASRFEGVMQTLLQMRGFAFILLWVALSTIWSQDPMTSFRNSIYLVINTLFAFYLSRKFNPDQQMQFFTVVGSVFLFLNCVISIALPQYGITHELEGTASWQGICAHKNLCAYTMTFLISQTPFMKPRGQWGRMLRLFYVVTALLMIVMTQSRTGWILTAAFYGFVWLLRLRRKFRQRDAFLLTVMGGAIFGILAVASLTYLPLFFEAIGKDATLNGRTPIWGAVMLSILKQPVIGYGFHAFWMGLKGESANVAATVLWDPNFAHNGLLQVWLEVGGVGVALLLATLVTGCKNAVASITSKYPDYIDWYLSLLFLTIIVNIDEDTLLATTQLGWTMYVLACVGLFQAKRASMRQVVPTKTNELAHA